MIDTALPASLTAAHLALAALRHHRARSSWLNLFVLPSFLFATTPWIWPSAQALIVQFCAHVVWVVLCEIVFPVPSPTRPANPNSDRPGAPPPARSALAPSPGQARDAGGFAPTTVLAVLEEATDIRTFRLARPHGFEFTSGQFVPVRVSIDGKPHVRCYSISSSPDSRGFIEISVRRQGLVSTTLHATLREGSSLVIGRAAGRFVYPANDARPLALLAGGIGITPLLSMLRFAVSSDPTRPITLLYSARDRHALAFLPELRVLAQRHPQVRIGVTVSERDAPEPWRRGRIDLAMVRQYVAHPAHTIFCVCGPTAMMADMERLLTEVGVPASQIRSEQFDTAVAATALNTRSSAHDVSDTSQRGYQLKFATSGRTSRVTGSQTLLEAAEAEGVAITFSCRSGVCQACRTRLAAGDVDCQSSVLDAEDRAAGFILPCVSVAQSDCVLEA
ncbi:MAG TPA: iron-sulfur cluster-binding domain-containing protein [Vicinamibacterales bacterium]